MFPLPEFYLIATLHIECFVDVLGASWFVDVKKWFEAQPSTTDRLICRLHSNHHYDMHECPKCSVKDSHGSVKRKE